MDTGIKKFLLREMGSEILITQEDWNINVKLFRMEFEEYL